MSRKLRKTGDSRKRKRSDSNIDVTSSRLSLPLPIPINSDPLDYKLGIEFRQELHAFISCADDSTMLKVLETMYTSRVNAAAEAAISNVSRHIALNLSEFFGSSSMYEDLEKKLISRLASSKIPSIFQKESSNLFSRSFSRNTSNVKAELHRRVGTLPRMDLIELHEMFKHLIPTSDFSDSKGFPLNVFPQEVWFKIQGFLDFHDLVVSCSSLSRLLFHLSMSTRFWITFSDFRFGSQLLKNEEISPLLNRLPRLNSIKLGKHIPAKVMHELLTQLQESKIRDQIESINCSTGPDSITDRALTFFFRGPARRSLKSINLAGCRHISDISLRTISSFCPNLERLNLKMCTKISDYGLYHLAGNCHSLEVLSLRYCVNISDAGVECIANNCHKLQTVSFRSCVSITDAGINFLAQSCPLKKVSMSKCYRITDASLMSIARFCPDLQYAHFSFCTGITDNGVDALVRGCQDLANLDFSVCNQISSRSIFAVAAFCKKLEHICLKNCPNIGDNVEATLRANCPRLSRICLTTQEILGPNSHGGEDEESEDNGAG